MGPPKLDGGIPARRGGRQHTVCFLSNDRALSSSRNLGQRERAEVEGQMRALGEGLRLKQQLIEEGVLLWREKQVQYNIQGSLV